MSDEQDPPSESLTGRLPFPLKWLVEQPDKVEAQIADMSVEEQARCVARLTGIKKQDFLLLSPEAREVTQALPADELYLMIKEIGEEDALMTLSMASYQQLQYMFDLEWWRDDKFLPQSALHWIELLNECDESQLVDWFQNEEFEQKVTLMQSLIKVFKSDEMTDSYEGVEDLFHFTLDGVYDMFFKIGENKALINVLKGLHLENQKVFYALLEGVIWYPVTPTLEKAYQWRLTRTSEWGFPEIAEALEVYSSLQPEDLKREVPSVEHFSLSESYVIAPQYPLLKADPSNFFSQCLAFLKDERRIDALRWELVSLANKVMVADRRDPVELESREEILKKTLGYVNIGLQLGAEGNLEVGANLLQKTWARSLFQVGNASIKRLRWQAEKLIKDSGRLIEYLWNPGARDQLLSLISEKPKMGRLEDSESLWSWSDFATLDDIECMEEFLHRWNFSVRFARQSLGLSERVAEHLMQNSDFPEEKEDVDLMAWFTTALANYTLFKKISCELLTEEAAKSFLQIIFAHAIFKDEGKVCDETFVEGFQKKLWQTPIAWTEEDKKFLQTLVRECVQNLESQFGRLDLKGSIEWKYCRGLCIKL